MGISAGGVKWLAGSRYAIWLAHPILMIDYYTSEGGPMIHRHAKRIGLAARGLVLGSAMLSLGVAAEPGGGPPGGPPGLPGIQGYEIVEVNQTVTLAPGEEGQFLTAFCPEGKKVLGGGRVFGGFFTVTNDGPLGEDAWQIFVLNRSDVINTANVRVFAICARAAD